MGRAVLGYLRRSFSLAVLVASAVFLGSAACGPSLETIDATVTSKIATAVSRVATPTPGLTREEADALAAAWVATAVASLRSPTPQPIATPQATPTPGLTREQADALAAARVATAIAGVPTPTPQPSPTPMATPTPQATPTPVSLPTLLAVVSSISGTATTPLFGSITLRMDPGRPVAGRDIQFALEGLKPWQQVSITFLDPQGIPAQWVSLHESRFVGASGRPLTTRTLYANGDGRIQWTRIGTQDQEGVWSLELSMDGSKYRASYPVAHLQLESANVNTLGLDFRLYEGSVTDSYYSALVPAATALDLQSHLRAVVDKMRDKTGVQSQEIPKLYLLANQSLFEAAGKAAGVTVGWEAGFFLPREANRGIYMKTDFYRTLLRQTLTHEYMHLLFDEIAPSVPLPAWVNEGGATYYELVLNLEFENPDIPRQDSFRQADRAQQAALSNTLIGLRNLESQRQWSQQSDLAKVRQQYAEAYMAARYLIERFGLKAYFDLLSRLGGGATLSNALQQVLGISYDQFNADYVAWLTAWQDPEREAARAYAKKVQGILAGVDALWLQRTQEIVANRNASQSARIAAKEGLVATAQSLQAQGAALTAPSNLQQFQSDLKTFLSRNTQWLQLEMDYYRTLDVARLNQANAMIDELAARRSTLADALSDIELDYWLQ